MMIRLPLLLIAGVIVTVLSSCSRGDPDDLASVLARPVNQQSFRLASFNIHYIAAGQKKLNWEDRKQAVADAISDLNADIIAFQEMETFAGGSFNTENKQLDWVLTNFPEYTAGAYGDAAVYPNTQPILFRHTRFRQDDQGFFFFSDTPDVIYSRTFNGSWPAFSSWSQLTDLQTGQQLTVFNVHFEYKSMSNRAKSAELVSSRIAPLVQAGQAVLLVGDTNAPSFGGTMRTLKQIPLQLVKPVGSTFHLNRGLHIIPAIDHVFHSEQLAQVSRITLLRKKYDGVWPADHYPLVLDLQSRDKPQ